MVFKIVFDKFIVNQLNKLRKNNQLRQRISSMFDKIEEHGSDAGKLIDLGLLIYEIKSKRPPIRLYFKIAGDEIYIIKYEVKKGDKKQKTTINKIKGLFRNLNLILRIFPSGYSLQIQEAVCIIQYSLMSLAHSSSADTLP